MKIPRIFEYLENFTKTSRFFKNLENYQIPEIIHKSRKPFENTGNFLKIPKIKQELQGFFLISEIAKFFEKPWGSSRNLEKS